VGFENQPHDLCGRAASDEDLIPSHASHRSSTGLVIAADRNRDDRGLAAAGSMTPFRTVFARRPTLISAVPPGPGASNPPPR
jgi:hypothetical protein